MAQCSDMAGFSPGNVDRSYGLRALHSAFYHPALTNVRVSLVIGESSCRPLKHCTSRPLYQSNSFAIKTKTNNKALLYFRSFLIWDFMYAPATSRIAPIELALSMGCCWPTNVDKMKSFDAKPMPVNVKKGSNTSQGKRYSGLRFFHAAISSGRVTTVVMAESVIQMMGKVSVTLISIKFLIARVKSEKIIGN